MSWWALDRVWPEQFGSSYTLVRVRCFLRCLILHVFARACSGSLNVGLGECLSVPLIMFGLSSSAVCTRLFVLGVVFGV